MTKYLQADRLDFLWLSGILNGRLSREDPPQLEVARDVDGIERPVGLALEGADEAVQVHDKIIPDPLLDKWAGVLDKKCLLLELVGG